MAESLSVSPVEAERAIHIDFEGTAVDPPSLLGASWLDSDDGAERSFHAEVKFKKDPKFPERGRHRLDRYLALIGYSVPKAFGPGGSAKRIRYVRELLEKKDGDYSPLSLVAKGKWTKALERNWHDCEGLRELVIRCAQDLSRSCSRRLEAVQQSVPCLLVHPSRQRSTPRRRATVGSSGVRSRSRTDIGLEPSWLTGTPRPQ